MRLPANKPATIIAPSWPASRQDVNEQPPNVTAAIYARYSSDQQQERSIEDQVALCRAWAQREGLIVVATFTDEAASGASLHGRPGMADLLRAAGDGGFSVVIAESLSRIGRDEGDRADIRKRLTFHGVKMATTADGYVSRVVDGIRAVIDSVYLDDLKTATRRGMAGVIRDKRNAGGRAYGYRCVPGQIGHLVIHEPEAAIVRRIFADYLTGKTPREIAHNLNAEMVPAPRGGKWNASTINGNKQRANGILGSEIYRGLRVWNRLSFVKDPDSGKRLSRINPESAWQRVEVPELAIIDGGQFDKTQERRKVRANLASPLKARPKRILSGLLRCAACGGGMSAKGVNKSGHVRIRCSTDVESGTCPNPRSFRLDRIEQAVLDTLRSSLQKPDVLVAYVREYHAERQRLASSGNKRRSELEKRLAEVQRKLRRTTEAMISDDGDMATLGAVAKELGQERDRLQGELASLPDAPQIVALHPAALDLYAKQLARLEQAIGNTIAEGDGEAVEALRDIVDSVTVHAGHEPAAFTVEITGRLNQLVGAKKPLGGGRLGAALLSQTNRGGSGGSGGLIRAARPSDPIGYRLVAAS